MINDFISGFNCALSGFTHIRRKGLRRFVIIPFIINLTLFTTATWFATDKISTLITWMLSYLPAWLEWLSFVLWLLFGALGLLIIFYTFTIVANFVGSPFNSLLSEKLESELSGSLPPSSGRQSTFASIKDALLTELQKLGYLLMWIVPLFLLTFVPIVNLFLPVIWFIFGAWMLCIEYMDYPMGNHEIKFPIQREQLRQNRALALGFGTFIMMITAIPVLNFFAMPIAVTGATQLWVKHLSKK